MNCYENYEEMLKNDDTLFDRLLSTAESKLLDGNFRYESYSDAEIMTLAYSMDSFPAWDIWLDYWDMDEYETLEEFHKLDIISEYVTRKLCCLIDTLAPKEEIEKWYNLYRLCASDYFRGSNVPMSDTEIKIFVWYLTQAISPEAFAESLSSQDIHTLLEFAADELPNHDMPLDETDSEWSKYQIVSQYIRTILCYWLDQNYSWDDIDNWYRLNFVFNYSA